MALITSRGVVDEANIIAPTYHYDLTIANGATQSDHFKLSGANVVGILFPAAFTGATLTVEVSFDGSSWHTLTGVSITATANEALEITTSTIYGWPFVRFVSASAEAAERILKVLVKYL